MKGRSRGDGSGRCAGPEPHTCGWEIGKDRKWQRSGGCPRQPPDPRGGSRGAPAFQAWLTQKTLAAPLPEAKATAAALPAERSSTSIPLAAERLLGTWPEVRYTALASRSSPPLGEGFLGKDILLWLLDEPERGDTQGGR